MKGLNCHEGLLCSMTCGQTSIPAKILDPSIGF